MTSPTYAFRRILETFDRLRIPYMVGGSLASCVHGIPRSTNDVDLIADVKPEHISPLASALSGEFYADPELMRQALRTSRMFNFIHLSSSFKFDVYPLSSTPYHQTAFERRRHAEYSLDGRETAQFYVEAPEDAVLAKLAWYRAGNEVSERQWSDVLDMIRVQRDRLDLDYLRHWAGPLKVADLLETALAQGSSAG